MCPQPRRNQIVVATRIQRCWRSGVVTKALKRWSRRELSAIRIQRTFRGWVGCSYVRLYRTVAGLAALAIQRRYRAFVVCRLVAAYRRVMEIAAGGSRGVRHSSVPNHPSPPSPPAHDHPHRHTNLLLSYEHTNHRREGADRVAALPVASVCCVHEAGLGRSDRHTGRYFKSSDKISMIKLSN